MPVTCGTRFPATSLDIPLMIVHRLGLSNQPGIVWANMCFLGICRASVAPLALVEYDDLKCHAQAAEHASSGDAQP